MAPAMRGRRSLLRHFSFLSLLRRNDSVSDVPCLVKIRPLLFRAKMAEDNLSLLSPLQPRGRRSIRFPLRGRARRESVVHQTTRFGLAWRRRWLPLPQPPPPTLSEMQLQRDRSRVVVTQQAVWRDPLLVDLRL